MRVLVVVVALVCAVHARADDAAMKAAYASVDYEKCRTEAQKSLQQAGDKSARVDEYKHLGLCQAALGDTDAARDAFKLMLTVDKDAKLPDGLSPRFTSSFREAKGALVNGTPLQLVVGRDTVDGGTRTLLIGLTDNANLVKSVAWRGEGGVLSAPLRASPKLEMEVPANVAVTLVALDAAQGEVATLDVGRPAEPKPVVGAGPVVEEDAPNYTPVIIVVAVVAGVLIVAGAGTAIAIAVLTPPQTVTLKTDVAFQK